MRALLLFHMVGEGAPLRTDMSKDGYPSRGNDFRHRSSRREAPSAKQLAKTIKLFSAGAILTALARGWV